MMKKLTKTPIFLMAVTSLLTSCSNDSIAGTYGFQLGKEKGTHFGIYLKLYDSKFKTESTTIDSRAKNCTFSFAAELGDDTDSIAEMLGVLATFLGQDSADRVSIPGYYYQSGKAVTGKATEIKLGVDFNFLKEKYPSLEDLPLPEITPEQIELIVYTTYASDTVTLNIPVSVEDAVFQLYWYGVDFTYDTETEFIKIVDSPYKDSGNRPGTHPSAEDVTKINEEYNYRATHQELAEKFDLKLDTYRDYYTLAMGLVKN